MHAAATMVTQHVIVLLLALLLPYLQLCIDAAAVLQFRMGLSSAVDLGSLHSKQLTHSSIKFIDKEINKPLSE